MHRNTQEHSQEVIEVIDNVSEYLEIQEMYVNGEIKFQIAETAKVDTYTSKIADNEWPKLLTDKKEYRPHRVLKALIAEGLKPVHHDNDTERVKHIFTNIITRRKYRINHNDLLLFLHEYALSRSSLYDFIIEHNELSRKVFDEHELSKIKLYRQYSDCPTMQRRIELAFSAAEAILVWR